jgi:nanoRNase/pAp phosphatase (c-di-AMP/oligoRNAs hydrolase)
LSERLNRLLWVLGRDAFVGRFLEYPSVSFSSIEDLLVDNEIRRMNEYIQEITDTIEVMQDREGNHFLVCFAEQYASQIADCLLGGSVGDVVNYIAVVNMKRRTVQLRSRSGFDVSTVAEKMGGGGHAAAAGFEIKQCYEVFAKLIGL